MNESRTGSPAELPADRGDFPYTDAELDRAFLRTQRSDAQYVAVRVVMLGVVFWLMARAIVVHDLTAGFLLLPLAVEVVGIMWVGLLLRLFVIDCERFARTAKTRHVVVWTGVIGVVISIVLAIDSGSFSLARIGPGWRDGWRTVLETGLVWALIAELLSVAIATLPEVRRWRRVGGPFVWTAVFDAGVRVAALIVVGFVAFAVLVVTSDPGGSWLFEQPRHTAWFVWSFLLCVEATGLVLGVKIHRDLERKNTKEADVTAEA